MIFYIMGNAEDGRIVEQLVRAHIAQEYIMKSDLALLHRDGHASFAHRGTAINVAGGVGIVVYKIYRGPGLFQRLFVPDLSSERGKLAKRLDLDDGTTKLPEQEVTHPMPAYLEGEEGVLPLNLMATLKSEKPRKPERRKLNLFKLEENEAEVDAYFHWSNGAKGLRYELRRKGRWTITSEEGIWT